MELCTHRRINKNLTYHSRDLPISCSLRPRSTSARDRARTKALFNHFLCLLLTKSLLQMKRIAIHIPSQKKLADLTHCLKKMDVVLNKGLGMMLFAKRKADKEDAKMKIKKLRRCGVCSLPGHDKRHCAYVQRAQALSWQNTWDSPHCSHACGFRPKQFFEFGKLQTHPVPNEIHHEKQIYRRSGENRASRRSYFDSHD